MLVDEPWCNLYYQVDSKHLIVIPPRNGSTKMDDNLMLYKIVKVNHLPLYNSIVDESIKKTFIYRDPCLRLMSFYNRFVYQPYKKKMTLKKDPHAELFKPKNRGQDLLSDILFASDNIIKNYKEDAHTIPQSSYFDTANYKFQQIDDYEIISVDQYVKWLNLTFGDVTTTVIPSPLDELFLTPKMFLNFQKVNDLCKFLYHEDYDLLEPKIVYI